MHDEMYLLYGKSSTYVKCMSCLKYNSRAFKELPAKDNYLDVLICAAQMVTIYFVEEASTTDF